MKNLQEEIDSEINKYLRPIGILQAISLMAVFSSPFFWIWTSWSIAWKVGLSGILAMLVFYLIYSTLEKAIRKGVNDEIEKRNLNYPKSKGNKLQDKMEELMNKNK